TLESAIEGIRYGASDYLTKPFDVSLLLSTVKNALARRQALSKLEEILAETAELLGEERKAEPIVQALREYGTISQGLRSLFRNAPRSGTANGARDPRYLEFIQILVETLEGRDPYSRGHAARTAHQCRSIGAMLGFSPQDKESLEVVSACHDIGQLGVSSTITSKKGSLGQDEWKIVRQHPAIGARLMEPLDLESDVLASIRHHHEHWDGSGYPDGVQGKNIPIFARIVLVADAYEAMSSERPYRQALNRREIVSELRKGCRTRFDPELVDLLLKGVVNEEWKLGGEAPSRSE
ncbi:MAG: response regulator, partial [Vicinamibacteria bacterium]